MARYQLDRLEVRNFRGVEAFDFALPPPRHGAGRVAVLAGGNGCGKTAILEAALIAIGRSDLLPDDTASLADQVRVGAGDFHVAASLTELRPSDSGHLVLEAHSRGLQGSQAAPRVEAEYFSSRREPEGLGATPDPRGAPSVREARRVVELKRKLVSAYYRGMRNRTEREGPFERVAGFVARFLPKGWTLDVFPVSNDPGSGDDVVVRDGPIPPEVTSLAALRRRTDFSVALPLVVPIDRLSSGQLALFAFAGPLVFRDAPADLVVIDEPELHLHPLWQRWILPALVELCPASQFLVATHSRDVLASAFDAERFVLEADEEDTASPGVES